MLTRRKMLKNSGIAALAAVSSDLWMPAAHSQASTFDYFISPTGDDNNAGTLASPWSITALNSKTTVYSGKRVGIIGDVGGTQTPITHGTVGGVKTTLLSMQTANAGTAGYVALKINGGTSSAPTYLGSCKSSGVYTPLWAQIQGGVTGSGNNNANTILMGQGFYGQTPVPNVGYLTLDGLDISGGAYANVLIGDVQSTVLHGVIVQNCHIHDAYCSTSAENPAGLFLGTTNGAIVTNTQINTCHTTGGSNFPLGQGAITTYSSVGLTVTRCTFYDCGYSLQMKDGNQWATVSYSYMDSGNFGSGANASQAQNPYAFMAIVPGSGETLTIHHCIVLGLGIRCYGEDGKLVTGSVVAYNNTFYAPPASGPSTAIWVTQTGTGPHQWYNNIVNYPTYSSPQGSPYEFGSVAWNNNGGLSGSNVNYNYYGTGCTFGAGTTGNFSTWQALGYDANGHGAGSPFSGAPVALSINSFQITGAATTAGRSGAACGALDGSGTVGCSFAVTPVAPRLISIS
jgi:hypothetical protein